MRKNLFFLLFLAITVVIIAPSHSNALPLFSDNFESGLTQWTTGNGSIVPDPLESDNALTFTATAAGGDIFSKSAFTSPYNLYLLELDYLGTSSSPPSGGYIGVDLSPSGEIWIGGDGSYASLQALASTGSWQHYAIPFATSAGPVTIKVEDWSGDNTIFGDAYFDNIKLSAIPEPTTMFLLGFGLIGLAGTRRKIKK